jgi:hypothetical protein
MNLPATLVRPPGEERRVPAGYHGSFAIHK